MKKHRTSKGYTRKTRELMVQLRDTVELIPLRWSSTLVRVFGAAAPSEFFNEFSAPGAT